MPTRELVSRDLKRVRLGDADVDYVLVRRRGRRGVGLKVDPAGLTVSAPLAVSVASIEGYLRSSERWITQKLAQWDSRKVPAASWSDGAALPYLGRALTLRTATAGRAHVEITGDELKVAVPVLEDPAVRKAVIAWYKRAALAHMAGRAFSIARDAGLPMPRVFLSSARTRWGSCNSKREIRLAWRLVKAPPAIIDYVVCHELAHLRHLDHSRSFWSEVERLCPGHKGLRAELEATDHLYRSF
jgi:predicted metal-dependent hydrolase